MRSCRLLVALFLAGRVLAATGLVPVEKFAAEPEISRARLSPDGQFMAYLGVVEGDAWLFIMDLGTKKRFKISPGAPFMGESHKEVAWFHWISSKRIGFLATIWDGQFFTGMSAIDCDGENRVAFTGPDVNPNDSRPLLATEIIHSFGDKEQNVLMIDRGSNEGKSFVYPDVIIVSTLRQSITKVVSNPGNVVSWVADRAGVVRLGITLDGLRYGAIYRENEQTKWRTLPLFAAERGLISPLGFDASGKQLIVAADNDQKRRAVFFYDIAGEKLGEVIASHAQFDIIPEMGNPEIDGVSLAGPIKSESDGTVLGIRYLTEGPRTLWFDPRFAAIQAAVDKKLPDTVNLVASHSQDQKKFLVLAYSDRDPGTYYLLDFQSGKPEFFRLTERMPGISAGQMAPMFPIQYRARDGAEIHGYLTLPVGEKKRGLPLIVLPHGGPTVRDVWGYAPWVQFLASCGYAVLQMDYRGSPGYGTEFYEKGKREIGRGMQTDIDDGTRWAIAQGYADPARIAIVGASYGGYSVLYALAHSPELYRCGISIAGVTDWQDIIKERKGEEYKFAFLHWKEWIGDPQTDVEFLGSISPVNFAGTIQAPLLIVQGKDDRIVPPKQARKMVTALEKAGRKPQVLYFADEGHGFRKEKNRLKLLTEMEKFLARNLAPASGH